MNFQIVSGQGDFTGSLLESLKHMSELGAMLAIEVAETRIDLCMMMLSVGESLTLDDSNCTEVKVTRID